MARCSVRQQLQTGDIGRHLKMDKTASALTGGQRAAGGGQAKASPPLTCTVSQLGKKDGEGERGEKGGGRQLMEIADARGADGSAVDIYEVALL